MGKFCIGKIVYAIIIYNHDINSVFSPKTRGEKLEGKISWKNEKNLKINKNLRKIRKIEKIDKKMRKPCKIKKFHTHWKRKYWLRYNVEGDESCVEGKRDKKGPFHSSGVNGGFWLVPEKGFSTEQGKCNHEVCTERDDQENSCNGWIKWIHIIYCQVIYSWKFRFTY